MNLKMILRHTPAPEGSPESVKWPKEKWAIILTSLLKRIALEVHSRLSHEAALEDEPVRKALLGRAGCTDAGCRVRFRNTHPQRGEMVF